MEEKEAKEDQGVRDAGQLGATSDLSDKEDGACAPLLPLMEEKEAKEDQGVRDAGQLGATSDFPDLSDKEDGACASLADGEDEGAIDAEEDGRFLVNGHG